MTAIVQNDTLILASRLERSMAEHRLLCASAKKIRQLHSENMQLRAQAQAAVPPGFALVPLRLTRAMDEAMQEEGWQWEDLLAAAEAIREGQYESIRHDSLSRDETRAIFLDAGFTIEEGQTDLRPNVYDAAQHVEHRVRAEQAAALQAPAATVAAVSDAMNVRIAELEDVIQSVNQMFDALGENLPIAHLKVRRYVQDACAWSPSFPAPAAPAAPVAFQTRVQPWLLACFGAEIAGDRADCNHRFLEEAIELVQANGCTASEAHQLVDYVYGRPVGEPAQEVGGVMVTLAALCLASGLDMHAAGETELARIWTKVESIRAKKAAKPKHSPLPAAPSTLRDTCVDWDRVPEDSSEREMFDRNLDLYGGDPRVAVATSLRIWANTRGTGSFGGQCAVMANEVAKLRLAAAPALEAPSGPVRQLQARIDPVTGSIVGYFTDAAFPTAAPPASIDKAGEVLSTEQIVIMRRETMMAPHQQRASDIAFARAVERATRAAQHPVRIYDYVWPQTSTDRDECRYSCSLTPTQHLAKGELYAVVHPSQIPGGFLQRETG